MQFFAKEILNAVLNYMRENHVEPYDEVTGKGLVRHILIRYGFKTKEIMVCIIINGRKIPNAAGLVEKLKDPPATWHVSAIYFPNLSVLQKPDSDNWQFQVPCYR